MSQRELRAALGPDVSRRVMLQGLGLGLAGVALAPAARATTLGDGADPVWTYKGPSTSLTTGLADLGTGAVFVTERRNMRRAIVGSVTAVDIRTADVLWTRSNPDGVFLEQMFGTLATPTSVFVSSYSGHVWCFDAATGKTRWRVDGITGTDPQEPAFAVAGSTVVYPDLAGTLYARNVADGTLLWSVEVATPKTGAFVTTPLVGVGTVVVVVNDEVHAYGLAEGDLRWKKSVGTVSKRPTIAGGAVCLAEGADSTSSTAKSHLRALALKDGTQTWRVPSGGADGVFSAPTAYNGAVYYADSRGTLHAVDETTGAKLWTTSLGGNLSVGEIIADSGILYLVGDSTKQSTIYAVEIASKGQKVVSYNPPVTTARVVGVESGQCFWSRAASATAGVQVGAVNLADAFQEFFAESQLMVQDYQSTAGGDGYQGSGTTWRSHLQLLDPSGTPRADTSVRVWCEQSTTVVSDGISYSVGPDTPAWLSTDPSGELGLTVSANDPSTSDHALTCPPLYLWGNFMDPGEAMVIYPDHDTYVSLSTVQGSTLSGASDYSGSSLLPGYSSSDSEHLASTIRNTIGGTGESLGATQSAVLTAKPGKRKAKGKPPHAKSSPTSPGLGVNAGAVVSYIAFPDSTTNLVYQSTTGPTDRAYVPGPVDTWTADFATDGTVTFTADPLIDLELEPSELGSIFSDIKDFVKHVVHDGEKIEKMTWKAVKGAYQYIKTTAGNVFKLIVDSVEKAASVVAGIFTTIVKDLVKVVEALSYLFEWGDILAVHEQLSAKVDAGFSDLKTWVGAIPTTTLDDWFAAAVSNVKTDLGTIRADIAGTPVQSPKSSGGNQQSFYGAGGAKSYTQTRWATDKVKQNVAPSSGATVDPPEPGGSTPDLGQLVLDAAGKVGDALEADFSGLPADLKKVFTDLVALVSDPSAAGAVAVSDLIGVIENIVVDLITFAGQVVDIAVDALTALVDAVYEALTAPIPIPVLSDLYKLITRGDDLSILNLVCLVVAIPTTIVQKAVQAAEEPSAPGAIELDDNIGYVGALAFYMVMDPFNDLFEATGDGLPVLSGCLAALSAVILTLEFPSDLATNTSGEYVFWAIQFLPILLSTVALATSKNEAFKDFNYVAIPTLVFYGFFMTGASIYLGATNADFRGKDDLVLIQNAVTAVPYGAKFLILSKDAAPLVAIDAVCDVASMCLGAARLIVES
jgi:outer membrane protein assembly factor BamB